MSPLLLGRRDMPEGFPRVSGDEPATKDDWRELAAFSPRERG